MVGNYEFPQVASATTQTGERGIASLYHPEVGTLRFRSNPKEFNWAYTLTKRVDQTYGGRVIQLLGTRIEDFTFKADCGNGRWEYMAYVANFMRDIMIRQRGGIPATFAYTTRGWKFDAYITSIPFADAIEEVAREFEVTMKVQEDVSGLMSKNTLAAELRRLQDGVGFRRSQYNDPRYLETGGVISPIDMGPIANQVISTTTSIVQDYLPGGSSALVNQQVWQANDLMNKLLSPTSGG